MIEPKLKISNHNKNLVLDEYGNELFEFKGDYYADLLWLIKAANNYKRYSIK